MIGRNCKRLRQRAGMTQEDLAERLHVTRQAVSAWETEKNRLDAETLVVLAEALGADVQELLYGPGAVQAPFARYQRRYRVCTVLCAAVVIAWLVMEVTLKPYLDLRLTQYFDVYPYIAYRLTVPSLGVLGLGCLIPLPGLPLGGHPGPQHPGTTCTAGAGPSGLVLLPYMDDLVSVVVARFSL